MCDSIPKNVIGIDAGESTGFQNNACSLAIQSIKDYLDVKEIPFGKIIITEKLKLNPHFMKRPVDVPKKFRY